MFSKVFQASLGPLVQDLVISTPQNFVVASLKSYKPRTKAHFFVPCLQNFEAHVCDFFDQAVTDYHQIFIVYDEDKHLYWQKAFEAHFKTKRAAILDSNNRYLGFACNVKLPPLTSPVPTKIVDFDLKTKLGCQFVGISNKLLTTFNKITNFILNTELNRLNRLFATIDQVFPTLTNLFEQDQDYKGFFMNFAVIILQWAMIDVVKGHDENIAMRKDWKTAIRNILESDNLTNEMLSQMPDENIPKVLDELLDIFVACVDGELKLNYDAAWLFWNIFIQSIRINKDQNKKRLCLYDAANFDSDVELISFCEPSYLLSYSPTIFWPQNKHFHFSASNFLLTSHSIDTRMLENVQICNEGMPINSFTVPNHDYKTTYLNDAHLIPYVRKIYKKDGSRFLPSSQYDYLLEPQISNFDHYTRWPARYLTVLYDDPCFVCKKKFFASRKHKSTNEHRLITQCKCNVLMCRACALELFNVFFIFFVTFLAWLSVAINITIFITIFNNDT